MLLQFEPRKPNRVRAPAGCLWGRSIDVCYNSARSAGRLLEISAPSPPHLAINLRGLIVDR